MAYIIDAIQDDCYEGTNVLINKYGLQDGEALAEIEASVVSVRAAMWEASPEVQTFDFNHYKAIHRYLFSDLYAWAGKTRTINLAKKGTTFCAAKDIEQVAQAIFQRLHQENLFIGLPKSDFAFQLSDFYQRTNELHPFREGNGRTQRVFLSQLCSNAGYRLDFSAIDTDLLMIATIQAAQGTDELLRQVLYESIQNSI